MRAQEMDTDQLYYWFGNGVTWVIPKTRGYPNHCESALIGREVYVCVYVVTSRSFAVRSYSLRQKLLGHLNQTLFFSFSCSPRASQSCLSQFSHQILYTNIEGTGKHKSVPTILTETVVFTQSLLHVKKEKFWAKNLSFFTFNKNP